MSKKQIELSKLSAMKRNKMSQPMNWLIKNHMIFKQDSILDYGCGQADDIRFMKELGYDIDGFDINWKNYTPTKHQYDVVTCLYVLNIVDPEDRQDLLKKIYKLLAYNGMAYFAVRGDINEVTETSRGWVQYPVRISEDFIVKKTTSMILYSVPLFKYRDSLIGAKNEQI